MTTTLHQPVYSHPPASFGDTENGNTVHQVEDLVKSHLMFAVREEVEVLKEQIKELMERIGNLEWENNYLRANVAPEVLTRMAQTPRSLPSSSSS